ncbi:hypothetical protein J6590_067291 [Homalodisca vitripennis]|nr:hypothetical protein J6590_067291 [Homalodisca vitripennis]
MINKIHHWLAPYLAWAKYSGSASDHGELRSFAGLRNVEMPAGSLYNALCRPRRRFGLPVCGSSAERP